ncbi:flavodoxin [Balneatrix alpica]|uniref:Flavodoxin n=1 Tax=Balneatrix alpica TaxID=75684 RepID=A0ABV5ZFM0_9GAMM|nr:flavodoxin [Balneatrix alpica]
MSHPRIALFYGSTTGNTDDVAQLIQTQLSDWHPHLYDLKNSSLLSCQDYSHLILGIPTWDYGGLQEDWEEQWALIPAIDWRTKQVALFGVGDQVGYDEWFVDAMGLLHTELLQQGARIQGYWPNQDYEFSASKALLSDGRFCGLAIDEDCQHELTTLRVEAWCQLLRQQWAL